MVIRSDALPFTLTFSQYERRIPVVAFSTDSQHSVEEVPEIVENLNLEVLFDSEDEDARFYMDGLELLTERMGVEIDDLRQPYLMPETVPYELFRNNADEFYPLIPGYYRIRVAAGGEEYFSLVQVVPKQLTKTQWEIMRDELEEELTGLAQDLIRKNLGVGDAFLHFLPPEQLFRFLVIKKRFASVMAALSDLVTKVNYRIRKDYKVTPIDRAKGVDEVSVRYRLTHPEDQELLKTPVRVVDYDLPENRWIKRMVHVLSRYLEEIEASVLTYRGSVERELAEIAPFYAGRREEDAAVLREKKRVSRDLYEYSEMARKMKNSLQFIKLAPWYEQVSQSNHLTGSPVLMYDARYRALFQLYRELQMDSFEVALDSTYAYQWKRTDQLYEIWGFLRICKALSRNLGYEPVGGWIYNADFDGNRLLIPTLPPDTTIVMEHEDIRLHLVYNSVLPSESGETTAAHKPVYMLNKFHDRPDGRMDIYKDGIYAGSITLEFKYRPRHGRFPFWDPSPRSESRRPAATNQLIAYRGDSASRHLYGDRIDPRFREQIRPVFESWAIYPKHTNPQIKVEYDEEHHVRLLQLAPGEEAEHLTEQLEQVMTKVLSLFDHYAEEQ
ncbi:MAG TPA: DUF2357 domain-containing protein [Bacilli bacterium]|nr:DUF2357 domain-containing protein [Bacilli bacterium]